MSWNQVPPQQRYSAVPGFERQAESFAPTPPPRAELDRSGSRPDIYSSSPSPGIRSDYSDPFTGGPTPATSTGNIPSKMYTQLHDERHDDRYDNGNAGAYGAAGAAAGGAAGYGAGAYAAQNQGYSYDSNDHGFRRNEGLTSDEIWAQDAGKERVRNYSYDAGNESSNGSRKRWWIIGGIIAVIIIACAVAIPVAITQSNSNSNSKSSKSGSGSGSDSGMEDPNDPSKFSLDPKLHKVFWGMAYQPDGVIPPMCGATQEAINRDMQILSQLTSRIRLYGGNCNCTIMVMEAIKQTKIDMEVYPAIYLDDNNEQAFDDQLKDVISAFQTYGVDKVGGLAVGNEYLLASGINAPSGAAYTKGLKNLQAHIQTVRTAITGLGLSKTIPIGTGDAGSLMSVTLAEMLDFFMANVHPWFGSVPVTEAADWTWSYFQENDVKPAMAASNQPTTYIAETGWPTGYMTPPSGEDDVDAADPSNATPAQLQTFLDTYVCQANANNTGYFYFEPFDQPWKEQYGGVEPFWGLFDKDRNLKDGITLPSC